MPGARVRSDLACLPIAERPGTEAAARSASSRELLRELVTASALDDPVPYADPSWPNQQEATVKGIHFIQEDSPHEIGAAVAGWMKTIG